MRTTVRAAVAAAAIAGAGLAGFGLTSAFAQTADDDAPTTTEAPAADEAGRPPGGCEGRGLDGVAEAIGIDAEELRAALEDGQTPAEVAEANGVSRAELVDAIVANIDEHLDQAVEDGHLTEAEADERRAEAEERANAIADGERPEHPRGPGGPPPAEEDEQGS
jgi:hypothetical protein